MCGMNPRKVLFGTDWTISSMESFVKFMDELNMPMRDKDLLFYENASRLFKIPIKPDATGLKSLLSRF